MEESEENDREEECERKRNIRVAMIKSSLLVDLLEVLSKKRGKMLREFVWLPFT